MTSSCIRGGLDWILGKMSSLKVVRHWTRLPRAVVGSLSLEGFKKRVDVALQDRIYQAWWCWVGGWCWWSWRSFPTLMILWFYSLMAAACQMPVVTCNCKAFCQGWSHGTPVSRTSSSGEATQPRGRAPSQCRGGGRWARGSGLVEGWEPASRQGPFKHSKMFFRRGLWKERFLQGIFPGQPPFLPEAEQPLLGGRHGSPRAGVGLRGERENGAVPFWGFVK